MVISCLFISEYERADREVVFCQISSRRKEKAVTSTIKTGVLDVLLKTDDWN